MTAIGERTVALVVDVNSGAYLQVVHPDDIEQVVGAYTFAGMDTAVFVRRNLAAGMVVDAGTVPDSIEGATP